MRDQELIGLYEAYQHVHGLNESTEEIEYDTQYSYEDWVNQLVKEGYDLSTWTDEGLFEYYEQLCEESLERGQSPTPGGINPKRTPAIPPRPPKGTPVNKGYKESYGESTVLGRLDTLARDTAGRVGEKIGERRGREATGNLPILGDIGATIGRNRGGGRGREIYDRAKETVGGLLKQSYEYNFYDTILEYLITEGYADTNENALVIMTNMSEDWKQSIMEQMVVNVADVKGGTPAAKFAAAGKTGKDGKPMYTPGTGVGPDFKLKGV